MNKSAAAQVQKLKKIAAECYHLDGGEMYECTDDSEYVDMIEAHGTAEKAWKHELEGAQARMEYRAEQKAAYADCADTEAPDTWMPEPEHDEDTGTEYYGCAEHRMFGDAWLYRDFPEAYM